MESFEVRLSAALPVVCLVYLTRNSATYNQTDRIFDCV